MMLCFLSPGRRPGRLFGVALMGTPGFGPSCDLPSDAYVVLLLPAVFNWADRYDPANRLKQGEV